MKYLKIIVVLSLISAGIVSSQNRAVSSVPVHISLVKGLSLNLIKNSLDFGDIISSPETNTISRNASEGIVIEISGNQEKNVTINYSSSQLSNSSWVESFGGEKSNLSFIPEVFISSQKNPSESQKIENGSLINLDKSTDGRIFVNIGGNLSLASNQPAGDYTGNISLTVSY